MKPIILPATAAALLFSSAPSAGISTATQPQLGGALALALAGLALIAAGFFRSRRDAEPAASGDFRPEAADITHQPSFFEENDMTDNVLDPNGSGGAEVIDFTEARLERRLVQRAERVCGRFLQREEEDHAHENLEV